MGKFDEFKAKLRPGRTYRRADLAQWSTAVDRHLKEALQAGALTKLAGGLYYAPRQTAFGEAPPEDNTLVATFLKGGPFLLASPNAYNALGVGTTQLHNKTVVYNHKRHGKFALGGRTYDFRMKPTFPKKLSREFLLVDLVNNLDQLGEDPQAVLERVKDRVASSDTVRLKKAAQSYGSERAKKFFARAFAEAGARDAA
jgi:hypothetical protein